MPDLSCSLPLVGVYRSVAFLSALLPTLDFECAFAQYSLKVPLHWFERSMP